LRIELAFPTIVELRFNVVVSGGLQYGDSKIKSCGKESRGKDETANLDDEIDVECHVVRRPNTANIPNHLAYD